jgi:hypothetical protein
MIFKITHLVYNEVLFFISLFSSIIRKIRVKENKGFSKSKLIRYERDQNFFQNQNKEPSF